MDHHDILQFWFEELSDEQRFKADKKVDEAIHKRFADVHTKVVQGDMEEWRRTPEGALAEIIVLDQFSRNMFRGKPESFAYDDKALKLARAAIEKGFDKLLPPRERHFLYMPFMHSESPEVHEEAVMLFEDLGLQEPLKYEHLHKRIIDRFGRYPHRNEVLGRETTDEERFFLENEKHSSF